ncbi:hypothetical protein PHLCEN_2v2075 [Hermanssonia centrifuga]|uniref:Uncharacterized protein n=1 Tax=Hermanssonia centrifuga TaxID=98765 RepID=A0A2R6RQ46_9APHY|nr:hypothetical protein PHLCEN_2v2075 [Hermanssonia centrifuga]
MSPEICIDLLGQVLRSKSAREDMHGEKKNQANLQAMHLDGDTAKVVSSLAVIWRMSPFQRNQLVNKQAAAVDIRKISLSIRHSSDLYGFRGIWDT